MAKHYIKVDITTPEGAPQILYPDGWDPHKIVVAAYDDIAHTCIATLKDEALFNKLMESGKVTELTKINFNNEITRLRPPAPDVEILLRDKGKIHKTEIEDLLKTKDVVYKIEEV